MRRTALSFLLVLPVVGSIVGACGGSAFDAGTGGAGAVGGSGSGVAGSASGVAGSVAAAGASSHGGSASAGASSGGSGNAAGTVSSGGSGGADLQACTSNSECEVVPTSCCSCRQGPVSNFTAINQKYASQYEQRCATADCVPCPLVPALLNDPTLYYVATCQAGRCAVVDLGATDATQCSSAADCALRSGTSCCGGCAGQLVALNASKLPQFSQLVCGSEPTACPACLPSFAGYSAGCEAGRCSVLLTPCTVTNPCAL